MRSAILLVRHCQSTGQVPEAPLTRLGMDQAEQLAEFLGQLEMEGRALDRLISSPFRRAAQSIAPFARQSGLEVELNPLLGERKLSLEQIPTWREIVRDSFDDLDLRAPGGESAREALDRAKAALALATGADRGVPIFVSHGNWISLLLHSIDGRFGFDGWESLSNPDVYRVELSGGIPRHFERLWFDSEPTL